MKKQTPPTLSINQIQELTIKALFTDDYLLNKIVLKGGNALSHAYRMVDRTSTDVDLSIRGDFDRPKAEIEELLSSQLSRVFLEKGCTVFDCSFIPKPEEFGRPELKEFWGGYVFEFKVISTADFNAISSNPQDLRRRSMPVDVSSGRTFTIEFSRHEYCDPSEPITIAGSRAVVYSALLIVIEKLRAICQQMPDYRQVVPTMKSRPRPRDFFDIFNLVEQRKLSDELTEEVSLQVIKHVFEAKRVALKFLGRIEDSRDFHESGFPALKATIPADSGIEPFGFYFNYVERIGRKIWSKLES